MLPKKILVFQKNIKAMLAVCLLKSCHYLNEPQGLEMFKKKASTMFHVDVDPSGAQYICYCLYKYQFLRRN